jgi:hypothetical protein
VYRLQAAGIKAGYPSSKNHETPFREEIEDIDLRRFALMEWIYYFPFP